MIMYGLGPEPNKRLAPDAWDIWHTTRIMRVAQTLGGEAKRWFFALEDQFKYDWEIFKSSENNLSFLDLNTIIEHNAIN